MTITGSLGMPRLYAISWDTMRLEQVSIGDTYLKVTFLIASFMIEIKIAIINFIT